MATKQVRKRADGEASREKILDAAAAIAGERGFQGATMSVVSKRSGLPASSIYHHFANKDELIAAVIDRSFYQWFAALDRTVTGEDQGLESPVHEVMGRVGQALTEFPDFLRLGIMLILDQNPNEPTARAKFLEVRVLTLERADALYRFLFPELDDAAVERLAHLTIALSDGLFVARDADGLTVEETYALMATAIVGTARELGAAPAAPVE